jgi:hypothetical protein
MKKSRAHQAVTVCSKGQQRGLTLRRRHSLPGEDLDSRNAGLGEDRRIGELATRLSLATASSFSLPPLV